MSKKFYTVTGNGTAYRKASDYMKDPTVRKLIEKYADDNTDSERIRFLKPSYKMMEGMTHEQVYYFIHGWFSALDKIVDEIGE